MKKGVNPPQAPALARIGYIPADVGLCRMVSCDLVAMPFFSLKAFAYSVYIAEIIEKMLALSDEASDIFLLVEEIFDLFAKSLVHAQTLRAFEMKVLDNLGYLPALPSVDEEPTIRAFDSVLCRFITEENETSFGFSPLALKLLKAMLIAKLGSVDYEEPEELLMIGRIFQSRLRLMGFFPLKSIAFFKQLSAF